MSEKTKMLLWKYGALFVMLLLVGLGKGAISGIQNRSKAAERLEYAMKEKTHTDKEGQEWKLFFQQVDIPNIKYGAYFSSNAVPQLRIQDLAEAAMLADPSFFKEKNFTNREYSCKSETGEIYNYYVFKSKKDIGCLALTEINGNLVSVFVHMAEERNQKKLEEVLVNLVCVEKIGE